MRTFACTLAALLLFTSSAVRAHAFPDHSLPHVGAVLKASPPQVKVWFDGELEPVFSTLIVKNASGAQVSTDKGQVNPANHALLETALAKALPAGTYTVYWSVIAHDGHHTAGHFAFTVQ